MNSQPSKRITDATATIPEDLMLSRIAQSKQMREFFIQMWLQNPQLVAQAGEKIQRLLSPLASMPSGVSHTANEQ